MNTTPLSRSFSQGAAAPGASTFLIGTALVFPKHLGRWNVTLALATGAVLRLHSYSTASGSSKLHVINSGVTLTAGQLYAFSFGVHPDVAYNMSLATDSARDLFQVDEAYLGAV